MAEIPTLAQLLPDTSQVRTEVLVDGAVVSESYQLVSISTRQEIDKIPSANILIVDGDPASGDFAVSSSNDFKPGKKILIKLGYPQGLFKVFEGVILSSAVRIKDDGSELNLEAKDETYKMTLNRGNNHFNNKSDTDIAEFLLQSNGITNKDVSGSTPVHKQLVQSGVTDWDFMIGRIDAAGLICTIDNAKVTIKAPNLQADAKLRLTYGNDILELDTAMDSRIQTPEVSTSVWDYRTQQMIGEDSSSSTNELSDAVNDPYRIRSSVSLTQDELKAIAAAKKTRQLLSKLKGKVRYQGATQVLPGDFIQIDGIGTGFSGKIFVSAIRHEYSGGDWITEATLGWSEQFFSEQTHSQNASAAAGQVSGIQGLQNAIVTDIMDADGDYRVKVRLPAVNDQDDGIYARVATLDAGNNRGTFFRPEVGDEVIVGFVNNDASHPVILGMLHSNSVASPLEPEQANDKKGYVSRSGIRVIINDGEKSITIETPGGNIFEMNDSANTIKVTDSLGNKLTFEQSGVTLEAATNLTLKAGSTLSIAAPNLSVKADASLSLEGSGSVSVNSSGITEVKGSLVKIN